MGIFGNHKDESDETTAPEQAAEATAAPAPAAAADEGVAEAQTPAPAADVTDAGDGATDEDSTV